MKKNTILQLIIIYIGLNAVYFCIRYSIQYAYFFISSKDFGTGNTNPFRSLISYVLLGLFGAFIIIKSGSISNFIAERSELDDSVTIYSKPRQLLSILIVIVALSHILDYLPVLLAGFAGIFSDRFGNLQVDDSSQMLKKNWLNLIFPVLMIIFCRNLTAYFSKNILLDDEDLVLHQDTVEFEMGEEPEEE